MRSNNGKVTALKAIKLKNTKRGYAIAIMQGQYRDGSDYYQVVRANPKNQYVALHNTVDYEEARKLANQEWKADMGA